MRVSVRARGCRAVLTSRLTGSTRASSCRGRASGGGARPRASPRRPRRAPPGRPRRRAPRRSARDTWAGRTACFKSQFDAAAQWTTPRWRWPSGVRAARTYCVQPPGAAPQSIATTDSWRFRSKTSCGASPVPEARRGLGRWGEVRAGVKSEVVKRRADSRRAFSLQRPDFD